MDPDRWQRINELFHAALEHLPQEREAFLDASCAADTELRREVDSLLESHAAAADFIDRPAFEAGAELLRGPDNPEDPAAASASLIGRRLGPYEVQESLGYGGMGVVYLAEDTRLDRRVAIKALASHLVRDRRSRERLRREAKAAAALSHPGIATVFALEEFDDHLYIVYEYAEGETLREELGEGPLETRVLIDTALAIAEALEAAHGLGIVHRDLKPENVIRTPDGGIKILDFGLASFQASAQPTGGTAAGSERLTLPGMLLGTPSYMAPEQLKGREVDFRADLFSFGVVFFELATGIHPFEGDDPASTIARILEVEPLDDADVALVYSPDVASILRTLLQKRPDDRYAATSDLVEDLERVAEGLAPTSVSAETPARSRPNGRSGTAAQAPRHDAFWWWRFHQLALAGVCSVAFYGLWWAKQSSAGGGATGSVATIGAVLFYVAVVPVITAGSLRIHLAFASRYYPEQLARQRGGAAPWIRGAELLYALILLGGAALIAVDHPGVAAPMLAAAVGIVVLSQMIEPATIRAAFPEDE